MDDVENTVGDAGHGGHFDDHLGGSGDALRRLDDVGVAAVRVVDAEEEDKAPVEVEVCVESDVAGVDVAEMDEDAVA